jgi:hypothetical protein
MKATVAALVLATTSLLYAPVHAESSQPSVIKKTLACGGAEVIAESNYLNIPNRAEILCTKQTVTLINSKESIPRKLRLDGKLVKKRFVSQGPVLDAVVVSWDCLKSKNGTPYILLWYQCNWGPGCETTNREWERIFDLNGKHLTAGFRKHDDLERLQRLYQTLGLSEEDIHFKSVIFDE